jgi:hypothetical protein
MNYYESDSYLTEVIPVYKRDYVLCDGSKYRISYRPKLKSSNITNQRESFDRFLNLFFALGYKYTKKSNLAHRTSFTVNE